MIPVAAAGSSRRLRCAPFGVPVVPDVSNTGGTGSDARSGPPESPRDRTSAMLNALQLDGSATFTPAASSPCPATITGASSQAPSSRCTRSRSMANTATSSRSSDFAQLGSGKTRVEVDDAESGLGCGDGQLDEVAVVATGDAQAVAALCADAVQALREPSRPMVEVAVANGPERVDDRRPIGCRHPGGCVGGSRRGPPASRRRRERRNPSGVEQPGPVDDAEQRREPVSQRRHRDGR